MPIHASGWVVAGAKHTTAPHQAPGPVPAPSGRWTGNLGPSLFLTAVERADAADRGRRELERMGRANLRAVAMTAQQRAANDMEPRAGLEAAKAAPHGRFLDLLLAGLRDGQKNGDAATQAHCADRLLALGRTALVPGAKSAHHQTDHGWRGLPAAGRRSIRDSGAVMDDAYGALGFWTVTLTPAIAELATREQIAKFQTRLAFFARRLMVRRGLPPHLLMVCEMHPKRRAMDGALVPHWHGVLRVAHRPFERWAIRPSDLHRVVDAAHRAAFGCSRGSTDRCNVLPQKTGAARYLAKYMSKGGSEVGPHRGRQTGRMVPRQWWTWTGELRALVAACRIKPPAPFLRFCCRWWRELEDLGDLAMTGQIQIGEDGPVVGRWFVWASEAALDRAIEGWIGEELERIEARGGGFQTPPAPS